MIILLDLLSSGFHFQFEWFWKPSFFKLEKSREEDMQRLVLKMGGGRIGKSVLVRSDWSICNRQTIDQITHAERFIGTLRLLRLSIHSVKLFSSEGKVQKQKEKKRKEGGICYSQYTMSLRLRPFFEGELRVERFANSFFSVVCMKSASFSSSLDLCGGIWYCLRVCRRPYSSFFLFFLDCSRETAAVLPSVRLSLERFVGQQRMDPDAA